MSKDHLPFSLTLSNRFLLLLILILWYIQPAILPLKASATGFHKDSMTDYNILVASYNGWEILKYDAATGVYLGELRSNFPLPICMVMGPDGLLYVIQGGNIQTLSAIDPYTGTIVKTLDYQPDLNASKLIFGPDGYLYMSTINTNTIRRYDITTGTFQGIFVSSGSGGLDWPRGMGFGPDGNLYVCSWNTDNILRYNGTTGAFIDEFVPAGSGGMDVPAALTFGPDGNLYVCNFVISNVLRYNGTTGEYIDEFIPAGTGGLDHPNWLEFGIDGDFYVGGGLSSNVIRYDGATGALIGELVTTGSGGLNISNSFAFYPKVKPTPIIVVNLDEPGRTLWRNISSIPILVTPPFNPTNLERIILFFYDKGK